MQIFDLAKMQPEDYSKRNVNVFFQNDLFKVRVISLESKVVIPKCEMIDYVMFYVIEGNVVLNRNEESSDLLQGQLFITEPAFVSMTSENGAKLLGIQIKTRQS